MSMEPKVYLLDRELYCEDCAPEGAESIPQPGESDTPQHCGECGELLDVDLTLRGRAYVCRQVIRYLTSGGKEGSKEVILEWIDAYGIDLEELMSKGFVVD